MAYSVALGVELEFLTIYLSTDILTNCSATREYQ